ncbi:hypothetical protein ABTI32_17715, partial [Acinetobacter baumannii]
MFKKNHFKIKRNDYYRVLTTEVLPYETPLIFNNFGLYNFVKFDFKSPTAIELQKRLINGLKKLGEFKHEVRQFEKSYDNQQAEQISL